MASYRRQPSRSSCHPLVDRDLLGGPEQVQVTFSSLVPSSLRSNSLTGREDGNVFHIALRAVSEAGRLDGRDLTARRASLLTTSGPPAPRPQ